MSFIGSGICRVSLIVLFILFFLMLIVIIFEIEICYGGLFLVVFIGVMWGFLNWIFKG